MVQKNGTPPPPAKCLGPVSDLERHLPSDWWRTLFNALYIKTDGDVVEHDGNTAREIDALIAVTGADREDRVLDLCCGQGRHAIELARRGFRHVTGLDRSRYLIRLARRRARHSGLAITFHEGDARKFRLPENGFHVVTLLGNSFGYFDRQEEDVLVLEAAKRALRSGGTLVLDITDGDWMRAHFERRSWEWIDQDHFVCRERSLSADGERLISREVVVHAEKGVIADQFYAERLYSAARITALLERAGFRAIRFHDTQIADSSRGQDLGMMARRMLLTAQAPAKTTAVPVRGRPPFPEVTVILGDPRLPDMVKREGRFNAEDLETVARLRAALGALGDYKFTYVDNHAGLIATLRAEPPQFVLNLCDEGFNNDATFELHVPALLEMLAIPYTGAGPTTLGLCYDKSLVRAVAMSHDVPVPLETYCDIADQSATIPSVFPALIKPNTGDSSLGITKDAVVHNPEQAIAYLRHLAKLVPGRAALIQEYLTGGEYSVGLIGNPGLGLHVLPVLEVDYSSLDGALPKILSYESKWDPSSPYWTQIRYREARLDDEVRRRIADHSITLFERLGCRDYARFDFRADAQGEIKLLEVNPNPGWCWDGKLNLMAEFEGRSYADLLRLIIDAAQARTAAARRMEPTLSAAQ
ncbi:MAG: methyltransferase domain-containing protein [Alphaproteobacteria bacterium]|nr:methyltransferase domain-containing protein [Alphaproteobacteria bacterium]